MSAKSGLRLDADYTEDVVGFALDSFLTCISFPRLHFSIEPFSRTKERWLGADARLHSRIQGFRPFYMQFKRPAAYPKESAAGIIQGRKKLNLPVAPRALYFSLRDKQKAHVDFQHNVLLRLRRRLVSKRIGDATYVCPLFLDRSAYRLRLHLSGLMRWPLFWRSVPWDLEHVLMNDGGNSIRFDRIPVFPEHVSIPPHETVTTAKHSYSFTEAGADLCFHSPAALPEGIESLARFLMRVSEDFFGDGEKIGPEQSNEELRQLIDAAVDGQPQGLPVAYDGGENAIGNWLAWGDYLRREYAIDQYAMVRWRE